ncbi:FtsL-like putative cell division protein [Echinicola jeungdonensis]|uniref:FtsL-like putative cell division protein n=1 Tax=Echinicola jeungdonensis TaxID=709343 RepID=A0ABV5J2W9_9BACT|nr:FtsL-like putative cell division protein [Echinicola jeungdonensis]MDN3668410.1 FtsL-like putative cell division protein [Echinicola jeungdonensis]
MEGNTFKKRIKKGSNNRRKGSGSNLFSFIDKKLNFSEWLGEGIPVKLVPPFLYAAFLALVYIWSNHRAENTIREIEKLQQEVEDLRADVTTLEAEYMFSSKQSEVAKKIKVLGIYEIEEPPIKIIQEK